MSASPALDDSQVLNDLLALVRINSQNPGAGEAACADWVSDRLSGAGLAVQRQAVAGARENVVATVRGSGTAPRLVLLAHMDTVPVGEGWTVDPLAGVVRNECVYGRGSADMKAGLAIAINLLAETARGASPPGDVVLCATVDEEGPEMLGAHALVAAGVVGPGDQVLALEPTGLRLRIAQVGLRWLSLTVHGRMAHAGRAHVDGVDANHVAARIVDQLKRRVGTLAPEHPLLGPPRATCGLIRGGIATNVVPPSCTAELDLRVVPPLVPEDAERLVRAVAGEVIAAFPGSRFELKPLGVARPPIVADDDCHLVSRLRSAHERATGESLASGGEDGHEAYTDASMIAALTGSDTCTVFGPGAPAQAHVADEHVSLAEVRTGTRVLEALVAGWGARRDLLG
jgi:succinyl-diaminopimelate desuccinylase